MAGEGSLYFQNTFLLKIFTVKFIDSKVDDYFLNACKVRPRIKQYLFLRFYVNVARSRRY